MYGTFWALVPPILAIVLALITKEAFSSLFIGVVVGAVVACGLWFLAGLAPEFRKHRDEDDAPKAEKAGKEAAEA